MEGGSLGKVKLISRMRPLYHIDAVVCHKGFELF